MELSLSPPRPRERAAPARRVAIRVLTIAAVFALALFLRLRAVELLPTDYDEDEYLRAGQRYAQHLAAGDIAGVVGERENYEHPPLTKLAYGAILLGGGPAAYAEPVAALKDAELHRGAEGERVAELARPLRGFSAWVGALTAALLAVVSPPAGLLLALSSWHIKYTSQAMLEALPCLFATACLLLLRGSRRHGDWRFWLAALALGLTAAGTYRYAAGGFAAVAWVVWRGVATEGGRRRPGAILRALGWAAAFGGVALLAFYAFNPALWPDPLGRLRESIMFNAGYSAGRHVEEAGLPWFQPLLWLLSALPWNPGAAPLLLDGLFGLAALLALPALWRGGPAARLTALWLLANLAFLFLWPTKWPQYVLALLPAAALAATAGAAGLAERLRERLRLTPAGRRELGRAAPWLWPAGLLLLAVAVYPLLLQLGMAVSRFQAVNIRPGQLAFWEALARAALTLPPMEGNPLTYVGLSPVSTLGWLIYPLRFNLLWVTVTIGLASALGLWLAALLNRPGVRGRAAWRTLFILPWAIPEFVGALLWNTIFDENFGALNSLLGRQIKWLSSPTPLLDLRPLAAPLGEGLGRIGLSPLGETLLFLADSLSLPAAFWVVTLVGVWVCFPFMLLVSSAALRGVPPEVIEAAQVDGASGPTLWRRIIWPQVAPAVLTGALLRATLLLNAFYLPQLVVGEGNVQRVGTSSLALIGYFAARYSDYSFAALINTAVLAVSAGLIWLFLRRSELRGEA